jgi:hypothetical protein
MKVLVLGATGGTGRLIVRFRPGERPFRRALVRSKASADLPGVDMIEGDTRDAGTLTCSCGRARWCSYPRADCSDDQSGCGIMKLQPTAVSRPS